MYTIYCHTFPHGKMYVGLTKQKLTDRFKAGQGYRTCPRMNHAIQKWGWENIDHDILAEIETLEEAERLEQYLIAWFKSADYNYGYNVSVGGNVPKIEFSEGVRYKIGVAHRGKPLALECREKIRNSMKGRFCGSENPNYGKKTSEETKRKQSVAQRGRWIGDKSPLSKPVLQYTKDGEFVRRWVNAAEVERSGLATASRVCGVALGRPHFNTAGGFVWKYEPDVEKVMDK